MNLEFIELDIEWPYELRVLDLKSYILSKLNQYGEPLRWAITSVNAHAEEKINILSVEAVLIINKDKSQCKNLKLH